MQLAHNLEILYKTLNPKLEQYSPPEATKPQKYKHLCQLNIHRAQGREI